MDKRVLNTMFENLLHIGNKTNFWNPKMKEYIYGSVNGIHVFNLVKTIEELENVKKTLKDLATEGKKILFVATKLQGRDAFANLAKETGHYYVTEKWVPGLLTNFRTIKRRIATYMKLLKEVETGALNVLTKKERATKMLELEKLDKAFVGLKDMKKTPDIVFVVDGAFERQALKEAETLKLGTFAILNTNGDPIKVDGLIPANTNSVKSLDYIASELKSVLVGIKFAPKVNNIIKRSEDKQVGAPKKTSVKIEEKKDTSKEDLK